MPTEKEILGALESVMDPCSTFNGTYLSMIDLGMIDAVVIDEATGHVEVTLFLDDPMCVYMYEIVRHITEAIEALDGVTGVDVKIKGDEVWTEQRMRPAAQQKLLSLRQAQSTRPPMPRPESSGVLPVVQVLQADPSGATRG